MAYNGVHVSHDIQLLDLTKNNDLSTGELYYHASDYRQLYQSSHKDIAAEFWDFLRSDSHKKVLEHSYQETKTISEFIKESYKLKLQSNTSGIMELIQSFRSKILSKISIENTILDMKLLELQKLFDSNVMQLVLEYYSILKAEVDTARANVAMERAEQQVLLKQAEMLRDIRLFACHLAVESRGALGLSLLPPESQQFVRCVKAVTDNVNGAMFGLRSDQTEHVKQNIRVRNVLKLQNAFLSKKLKAASEKVANGKVKGLFCCLSAEQFYRVSAFGLYAQRLPAGCRSSAPSADDIAPTIFSTPWFCVPPPLGVPVNRDVTSISKVSGTALRLATALPQPNRRTDGGVLRFSRYSTMSSTADLDSDQLERGVFLSLCRVLIVHQRTVSGPITEADIVEASVGNFDAIYSTDTEEYVLLQPSFVLPEFFMHVHLPDVFRGAVSRAAAAAERRSVWKDAHQCSVPPELQRSSSGGGGAVSSLVPMSLQPSALDIVAKHSTVSELLLQNRMEAHLRSRDSSRPRDGDNLADNSPRGALMRKQTIVLQLHELVQDFQEQAVVLMRRHAAKISATVDVERGASVK